MARERVALSTFSPTNAKKLAGDAGKGRINRAAIKKPLVCTTTVDSSCFLTQIMLEGLEAHLVVVISSVTAGNSKPGPCDYLQEVDTK